MGVRYTHGAITTEEQIEILKQRGLLIDDVDGATKALDTISYFRLAGYWRHFEKDHTTHQFKDGSKFEDVLDVYFFDKALRVLLFTAIQTIEVAARTKVIKHFAHDFGPFWFMDESKATNVSRFNANHPLLCSFGGEIRAFMPFCYTFPCAIKNKLCIFASTISATPLYNAYQGGTYFLYTHERV